LIYGQNEALKSVKKTDSLFGGRRAEDEKMRRAEEEKAESRKQKLRRAEIKKLRS
jgi:3'-phosphoadenosine 5'-phosphosulfate sulfotransferase (PAPS reductase)/FAD synthetase